RDVEVINFELILADTEVVERRLGSIERDVRAGKKEALVEQTAVQKAKHALEEGKLASSAGYTEEEQSALKGLHLLTMKPMLYVLNKEADGHNINELNDGRFERLVEYFDAVGATYVFVDANIENELRELQQQDKAGFRQEYGVFDDGVNSLIRGAYQLLGLMSFFTTGADETRAWTVPVGSTAPEAGAAIHTDFYNKFIRAEVINWQKLIEAGSFAKAREQGILKTEGKEYLVKDGDVMEFLHS
ncbi:MAG TPA: DUF933 domain-containing protein, partial [Candidatus Paceibacterota bacterium]